jgi:hypothetical protein
VILTIKAIKGTGIIEDSQIVMAMFRAVGNSILWIATARTTRTNKITHTVCGKGVVIIGEISLVRPAALYLTVFRSAEAAEANTALGDFA